MRLRAAARPALLLALLAAAGCGGGEEVGDGAAPVPEAAKPGLELPVDLYFPGPGGRLYPERRTLITSAAAAEQVRAVLAALVAGPEDPALAAPLPAGVELAGLYLGAAGVAYVDLRAAEGGPPPPAGSTEELQRVFSVVNSIALNIPEARRVVLLWNGVQPRSLAGHLDTSRPLAPLTELVARDLG